MTKERERSFIDQRTGWEERRVEQIQRGTVKPYLIVDDLAEYQKMRNLDTLTGTDKIGDIRYDSAGYLHIPIRYKGEIVEEGGKRRLDNPRDINYTIVLPKNTPPTVLNDLPEKKGVEQLIFHPLENIQDAMSQQRDILIGILKKLKKGEIQFVRQVIEFTEEEMLEFLQRGRITRVDVKELARRTTKFLEGLGVARPRDEKKRRSMAKLEDLVGKGQEEEPPNFLVTVSKLGAAHTAATDRLAKLAFYIEKFSGNYQVLFLENQGSLWLLRKRERQLEKVLWNYLFTREGARVTQIQKNGMIAAVTEIAEKTKGEMRVRPYVTIAGWLYGILVGGLESTDLEATREILETDEEKARKVIERPSVVALIEKGNFRDVKRRIETARMGIKKSVARYEKIETPLFL